MTSYGSVDFLVVDENTPYRTVPQPRRGEPAWTEFLIPYSMTPLRQFGGLKTWEKWSNTIRGATGLYDALKALINTPAGAITQRTLTAYPGPKDTQTQNITNVILEDVQRPEWEVEGADDHEQCVVLWARPNV